jgi:hypothetical protein
MALRPMRSLKRPKAMPPRGRVAKPTANAAKAAKVPAVSSKSGKNAPPSTSAAAVPQM